ncbi:MAG: hypothetical protein RH860_16430 [Cytophagales bacterium]
MINSKIASILFDEGIYKIPETKSGSLNKKLDIHGNRDSVILCLFINDDFSHPHDEELVLAENIMNSIKIGKNDFAWAYSKSAWENHNFEYSYIFIFAAQEHKGENNLPLNSWSNIENSKVLKTYSLKELISDQNKKRELWACLIDFNNK